MGASAQLATRPDIEHPNRLTILLAKQHHGASCLRRFNVHDTCLRLDIGQNLGVDAVLYVTNLRAGHRRVMGKVKPGALRVHQRAFLLYMRAKNFAQGFVHQVGHAVVALRSGARRFVDLGGDLVANPECAAFEGAMVTEYIRLDFLGVTHFKQRRVAGDEAFVADLAPALAVKRGSVQHHDTRLPRL